MLPADVLALVVQSLATAGTLLSFRTTCKATRDAAKGDALSRLVLARTPAGHCLGGYTLRQQLVLCARVEGLLDPTQPLTSYRRACRTLEQELRAGAGGGLAPRCASPAAEVPLRHYRTLCALALSDLCSREEHALRYEMGGGALGLDALGNFGESVRYGLSREWQGMLMEERYLDYSFVQTRPRRFAVGGPNAGPSANYIALLHFDRCLPDVVCDFLQTLDEQLWVMAGEPQAGVMDVGDTVHLHCEAGAIPSIAATLDRFVHEPLVQISAFRCLADLCMDYFSGPAISVTRRGRARHEINTERLEARRVSAEVAVRPALRARAEGAYAVSVKCAAMLFLMEWVEGKRAGADADADADAAAAAALEDPSCNRLDASRVSTLVELGAIPIVVACLRAALLESAQDDDVEPDEQAPLMIRDLGNFEHIAPMTFVLFALCEGSDAVSASRRREAVACGAVSTLCELMLARVAAEEDDPNIHPDPRGSLHFIVHGDAEAHAEALESGADPAWLIPPPDEPNWRWNGIVSAESEGGAEYVAF